MSEPRPDEHDLLTVVSGAGAAMAADPDRVPEIAVHASIGLGHDAASFRVLDDSMAHRPLESVGLSEDAGETTSLTASMADLVLQRGEMVVARLHPQQGEAPLPQPSGGIVASVAGPIWSDGWIAAVLVGVAEDGTWVTKQSVAAFGLLTFQAGLILDNAQRIEDRGRTAERLMQGDRLKADFLTTISHEMRTPLTVLMGSGATLEQAGAELGDGERQELIAAMNANTRILDDLVSGVLDFARLEAGELWVSFEPFDISAMVRSACERARGAIGDRDLTVRIEDGLLASGDVVLVRRIVSHLLENAVAHTPPGTTITASCDRREDAVVVVVADDGPGIDEADLPFVGERFFRGGDVNTRPKGLGLGLALALGILELHGSTLLVENGADGGARFSFALPGVSDPTDIRFGADGADDPSGYAAPHGRS